MEALVEKTRASSLTIPACLRRNSLFSAPVCYIEEPEY